MKRLAVLGPALAFAAILGTSLALPAWLGTEPSAAMAAGALVGLGALALGGSILIWRGDTTLALVSFAGPFLLAVASAGPFLPGLQPWVFPAAALVAVAPLAGTLFRLWQRCQAAEADLENLRSRLTRREGDVAAQADRIRRLDLFDPVTRLLNRRGFMAHLDRALGEGSGVHEAVTMILVEGRPPGNTLPRPAFDQWMAGLGQAVQAAVRGSDFAGRLDDHLVALLLPRCRDYHPAVERLRQALQRHQAARGGGIFLAGVAVGPQDLWPDGGGLLAAAQAALAAARLGPRSGQPPVWPVAWALGTTGGRAENRAQ